MCPFLKHMEERYEKLSATQWRVRLGCVVKDASDQDLNIVHRSAHKHDNIKRKGSRKLASEGEHYTTNSSTQWH